jgi:alkylation response protein AidB-like acyl-CoA dehydrogenase
MTDKKDIEFSEEQQQLLEIAENFCRDKSPVSAVRAQIETEDGFDPAVWQEMVELGWLGIAIPEEYGGSGLTMGEVVTIAEPLGKNLLATPFASSTLAAQLVIDAGSDEQKAAHLPHLAEGLKVALAFNESHGDWNLTNIECRGEIDGEELSLTGQKVLVTEAKVADGFMATVQVEGKPAIVLIPASKVESEKLVREMVIDETRRSYRLSLDGITVPISNMLDQSKTEAALERHHKLACLLLSAEACGGTAACLNEMLEYLTTRRQFDRFIGSYQALKHTAVDVLTGMEAARSFLYHAATAIDDSNGETAVRMAKAQSSDIFAYAGDRSIQFHGGFGFTYECDAQLYRRRALWNTNQHGDAVYHRKRLADILLG